MRILLVDDEPLALDRLQVGLRGVPGVQLVDIATDGIEAVEKIKELKPDLVLLDIQMPGMTGMEVASALADLDFRPEIVFVTAFSRFAPEAFEVEAADYLLKPVDFERLRTAIDRARRRQSMRDAQGRAAELDMVVAALRADVDAISAQAHPGTIYEKGIWIPSRCGAQLVPVETIDWIEAARDYVMIYTPLKSHILRATMSEMEERIDPAVMIRVHRSHMVRISAVTGVERSARGSVRLILTDQVKVQVGPSYVDAVTTALKIR